MLNAPWRPFVAALLLCACAGGEFLSLTKSAQGEDLLFADKFTDKLSNKWQAVGLKEGDYHLRNGGLEMRVQPGEWSSATPMLKVTLPFTDDETVIVSVKVTVLSKFTQEKEFAGVQLFDGDGAVFKASKERLGDKLVYTPGEVDFFGEDGEEGDFTKYKTILVEETPKAGPLRILVDRGYAYFQVGPTAEGKYHNHFYSAIRNKPEKRGFALITGGAPKDADHWVRFEDFKVLRR